MSEKYINPIDALLDENNTDDIVLFNEEGEELAFKQIAIIPLERKVYAILMPVNPIEDLGEDEALVFSIEESVDGEHALSLVLDDEIIDSVFEIYDELIDAQGLE